jgi:TfoX/Sxy family transcriptional regulator of competence genes
MFTGTHEQNIVVRLPEAERVKLLRQDGAAAFAPMPGRAMTEYVAVPPAMHGKPRRLRGWMEKALAYAAALPPKPKRNKKAGAGA